MLGSTPIMAIMGMGGGYKGYGWFWLSVLLSLLCPELKLPLSLK